MYINLVDPFGSLNTNVLLIWFLWSGVTNYYVKLFLNSTLSFSLPNKATDCFFNTRNICFIDEVSKREIEFQHISYGWPLVSGFACLRHIYILSLNYAERSLVTISGSERII